MALDIEIKIRDKIFSLRVSPEEKESILKAASLLNSKVESFEKGATRNKEDLLIMVAFDMAVDYVKLQKEQDEIIEGLKEIEKIAQTQ